MRDQNTDPREEECGQGSPEWVVGAQAVEQVRKVGAGFRYQRPKLGVR